MALWKAASSASSWSFGFSPSEMPDVGTSTDLVRTDGTSADRRSFSRSCDDRFHNRPAERRNLAQRPSTDGKAETKPTGQFPPGLHVAAAPQRL